MRVRHFLRLLALAALAVSVGVLATFGVGYLLGKWPGPMRLRGGHSLIFELDVADSDAEDLAERVVGILKGRIDPEGRYGLEWRLHGRRRFEVRMPRASEESRKARAAYLEALSQLAEAEGAEGEIVNVHRLRGVLENYVSAAEAKAMQSEAEVARRRARFAGGLAELKKRHPTRAVEIDRLVKLYKAWSAVRRYLDDPADLKRLIARVGVLEFRVAPYAPETNDPFTIPAADRNRYVDRLLEEGPEPGRKRGDPYQWFKIHGDDLEGCERLIVAEDKAGECYVLLSDLPDDKLVRGQGRVANAYPTTDPLMMTPAVGFEWDARGAARFARLTSSHLKHAMAVLLDDEVYWAPVIESMIKESAIIRGRFTRQEAMELMRTLEAGSLPARVNPEPVSERTFDPS